MKQPSFELRWGKGLETQRKRDKVRQLASQTLRFAEDGFASLAIDIDRPCRVVFMDDPAQKLYGWSIGRTAHVNLRSQRHKRFDIVRASGTVVHEAMHTVRKDYQPFNSIYEYAATEGIAYLADNIFSSELFESYGRKGPHLRVVERVMSIPGADMATMRRTFLRQAASPSTWESEDTWHRLALKVVPPHKLSLAEIVGVRAVAEQVEAGREIADILPLTSREVLGLRRAA